MEDEVINEVLDRIDSVGRAISEGAVAGFEVLVTQAVLAGVGRLVAALVFFAIGAFFWRCSVNESNDLATLGELREQIDSVKNDYQLNKMLYTYESDRMLVTFLRTASIASAAIGTIPLLGALYRFVNPEYYAIKEVLNTFGG